MAKVGEGNPYYYLHHPYNKGQDLFKIYDRNSQAYGPVTEGLKQDDASLLVDALNFYYEYHNGKKK